MEDSVHLLLDLAQAARQPDLLRTVGVLRWGRQPARCKTANPSQPRHLPSPPSTHATRNLRISQVKKRVDAYCYKHRGEFDTGGSSVTYRWVERKQLLAVLVGVHAVP